MISSLENNFKVFRKSRPSDDVHPVLVTQVMSHIISWGKILLEFHNLYGRYCNFEKKNPDPSIGVRGKKSGWKSKTFHSTSNQILAPQYQFKCILVFLWPSFASSCNKCTPKALLLLLEAFWSPV